MGFLDNSGDIILDATLTDVGRSRLSRGDGSFRIVKFALGDDEINYELYRNSNHSAGAHPSGSAYYDLDILQTPVLEALTDDVAALRSRLLRLTRTDFLYLPVLKLNEAKNENKRNADSDQADGYFAVGVDDNTTRAHDASDDPKGLLELSPFNGFLDGVDGDGVTIRIDQGLNTSDISPSNTLDAFLKETRYVIQIDNRLGSILPPSSTATATATPAAFNFLDDDNIAHYTFTLGTDSDFVTDRSGASDLVGAGTGETLEGPRGTTLKVKIKASIELQDSNLLFTKLGTLSQSWIRSGGNGTATIHYINTVIRIIGDTTGYRIDIPVRFVKRISG